MAADYLSAMAKDRGSVSGLCAQLRSEYLKIADNLKEASDKTMGSAEKIALLKETKQLEANAIAKVEELAKALRAQGAE